MRILFISESFPPVVEGGYEQLCQEVATLLAARGHIIQVVAATGAAVPSETVKTCLELEIDSKRGPVASQFWLGRSRRIKRDIANLMEVANRFNPNVVYIWNARNLSRRVIASAEGLGTPVVYFVAGHWPALPDEFTSYWRTESPVLAKRWLKKLAALPALAVLHFEKPGSFLRLDRMHFVSKAMLRSLQEAGIRPHHAKVIYNGVDTKAFFGPARQREAITSPLRVLYAGRLTRDKGLDTLADLFQHLGEIEDMPHLEFTVAGEGTSDVVAMLQRTASLARARVPITFVPPVYRDRMPALLSRHDVLVFPSRDEAMPRMVQEAMAAGLVVVGTTAGGTSELLVEDETGLTFCSGDSLGMLSQLMRLANDPELLSRLARRGQAVAVERHSITRMIEEIETDLGDVVWRDRQAHSALDDANGAI